MSNLKSISNDVEIDLDAYNDGVSGLPLDELLEEE